MFTKFHTICKIIKFKVYEIFFSPIPMGDNRVLEAKKKLLKVDIDSAHFILIPRWIRYISTKSHTHKRFGISRKKIFSTMRYYENHQQRLFFDNTEDISKIVGIKIQTVSICIGVSSTHSLLVFGKTSKSQFLVVFQRTSN